MRYAIKISSFFIFFFFAFASYATSDYRKTSAQPDDDNKKDTINIAFKKMESNKIVGAVSSLNASSILEYDQTIWANDVFAGRTLGMMGNDNIRGIGIGIKVADLTGSGLSLGNALFVVDGLPRDIEGLRLSEVEDITILKDANAAMMYGSAAVNGVVLITTKRGKAFDNHATFTFNYGMSEPLQLPNYLNSADYMTYYNKARSNDGLDPVFSDEMIENFRTGNKYRYPNVDYYSDEYLKSFRPYFDLLGEFTGGNQTAKYYINFGWNSVGSLIDFGQEAKAKEDIFNIRGNVDLKVNDWINTAIDATAFFKNNSGARGNYWSSAASLRPYEYVPLVPIDAIDPENSLLIAHKNDVDGKYLIGGNINNKSTPFGNSYLAGVFERIGRKFSFNNRIDFDLSQLAQGLSFHTNFSFDYFTSYDQTIRNEYSVYEAIWADKNDETGEPERIVNLKQYGVDKRLGSQSVGNTYFRRRFGFYGMLKYDRYYDDVHHINTSLLGYGTTFKERDDFQGVKHAHAGLNIAYDYANKYLVDFSGVVVNSVKLSPSNRVGFSPSLGVAWIVSEEDFLKDNNKIDLLKFRLSGGILNSDLPIGGFFYYDNRYGGASGYQWHDGSRGRNGTMSNWEKNPNLGFTKRQDLNFGVEGLFFNKTIGLEANLFYDIYSDLVTRPNTRYPSFYYDFIPYENYEKDGYKGAEGKITFNKSLGDFKMRISANMLYVTSERLVVDEVYADDYRYRKGHPRDASFGLEAIGLFADQADIDNSPIQAYGTVKPGDIKYKDQNGDGIVDDNDEIFLRRWQSPLSGGVELNLSYKNVSFYMLGYGRQGAQNFREGSYYWVDGNKKYSEVVLDSWTPETAATATYPRLSSQSNSNNFRRSSFWVYDDDFFQIRKMQLTYTLPSSAIRYLKMSDFNIFVDGTDIFQFATNKKVRETRVWNQPHYRTFSLGFKTKF